jgi:uncharacterized protein (DUF1330 family)
LLKSPPRRRRDREVEMAKGYWIPHIDVSNPEGYKAYMAATPAAHDKYGGHALVRGGTQQVVEGRSRSRNVLREFPDYATALACYRSAEYQRAKPLRLPHSVCDFVIIEGYDGAQPDRPTTQPAAAPRKGYWIAHVDVTEPEGYKAYMAADMAAFGKYGGRFLVRGGQREVMEGKVRGRTVVLEFPSYRVALDCYRSPEYQAAAALRKGRAEFDLFIIEGCDAQS